MEVEWVIVLIGAGVAWGGGWLQLHPARIFPNADESWQPSREAVAQVRLLGGSFVFMGTFLAGQMMMVAARQAWWAGSLAGIALGTMALALLDARARNKKTPKQQNPVREKALEAR